MHSLTVAQAALFACVAMLILTGYYLADNFVLLQSAPMLLLLGSAVPGVIWAGFFFTMYRSPASASTAAWITLVFAALLEALVVCIRFQQAVSYWTPFGGALSLYGWLLRLGWATFLISFAITPKHAQDHSLTRRVALVMAILSAPSALSVAYDMFNNWIGFLFDDIPRQAFWRVLITPVIRTIYWLSQILFLWSVWGNPQRATPLRQSSARLAP